MTNTNQSSAGGDVEAREAAVKAFVRFLNAQPGEVELDPDEVAASECAVNLALDAYLAKLTSTKAEPGQIADRKERISELIRLILPTMRAARQKYSDVGQAEEIARAVFSHIIAIEADKAALSQKVREVTTALDQQWGTPCEQIRHQQEVEALQSELTATRKALEEERERCAKAIVFCGECDCPLLSQKAIRALPSPPPASQSEGE